MARSMNKNTGKTSACPAAETKQTPSALEPIVTGNLSLHDLFQQQAMKMLDDTALSDEQKQSILIAMSCPCCGAGGLSFTAKLKREK